jgi:hypothetical protein
MRRSGIHLRSVRLAAAGLLALSGMIQTVEGVSDAALPSDLEAVFPGASGIRRLSPKSHFSRGPEVLEIRQGETLLGYSVSLKVVSRSGPFRMLVAVSPEERVMDVQIPKYPHRRGRAVRKQSFLDQFKGVSYGTPLVLGEQVDGVSGATSSATAVTGGVRQALLLVHRHREQEEQ